MKSTSGGSRKKAASKSPKRNAIATPNRVHPIVIYPFKQSADYSDLEALYQLVGRLDSDRPSYVRPITVIDRKTHYAMNGDTGFSNFRNRVVGKCSDVMDAWCVDTCQMWYTGLGHAFETGREGDVYWLIPGDFNYGTTVGHEVLGRLHDLPEIILELDQDLCIGEIETDHNDSKQLIDTYGTFALLYNWFPAEAEEIRQFTERPRSEFFAVSHNFLGQVLAQKWYAYEQTVVMLLQAIFNKRRISRFFVGKISDLPEGRESVASALQQVERTERVLKTVWRERNQSTAGWLDKYRALEVQSEEVRRAALTIFERLLD